MRKLLVLVVLIVFCSLAFSQDNSIVENTAESTDSYNPEQWIEDYEYFKKNPLNINTATKEQLSKLHLLNDFQMNSIIDYRKTQGDFVSIFELKLLYGWDDATIQSIVPYVTVNKIINFNQKVKHRFLTRTVFNNTQDSSFAGNGMKFISKYYFDINENVHAGFSLEKDAGEESFRRSNKTFDFVSGSVVVNAIKNIKTIAVGDYQACFGQGLLLWTGFGLGKSPYILSLSKRESGFTRYSSTDENRMMRGAATTLKFGTVDVSLFYSRKNIDASISEIDSSGKVKAVSSFQNTGLHRTTNELKNEKSLSLQLMGANIRLDKEYFKTGITFVNTRFGALYNPANTIANIHHFRGNELNGVSGYYTVFLRKTEWFGEIASRMNKEYAMLHGVMINLSSSISTSFLYRNYSTGYYSFFARGFGENSEVNNEKGLFWGMQLLLIDGLKINGYADVFEFPWLRYTANQPTRGTDKMIEATYLVNDKLSLFARIKQKKNEENAISDSAVMENTVGQTRTTMRFNISYKPSEQVELRNRIEICNYKKESLFEKGYYLHQDLICRSKNNKFSFWVRYGVFQTDGYNSRIYTFENDMPYVFSMPAYYGKGSHSYAMIKYKPIRHCEIGLRYGITWYDDMLHLSNTQNSLSAQIMCVF